MKLLKVLKAWASKFADVVKVNRCPIVDPPSKEEQERLDQIERLNRLYGKTK